MTYVITNLCKREGACADVCPVDCIVPGKPTQQWPTFYIDPDTCIECGACVPECPNAAIFPEEEVPAGYEASIRKNHAFFASGPGYSAVEGATQTTATPPRVTWEPTPKRETFVTPPQRSFTPAVRPPQPRGTIFISYKREDWNYYVKPLVDSLRNQGFSVWVDQHLIEGGTDWQDEINAALKSCAVMVLCVTPNSLKSIHIKTEYRYFYTHQKPLIPLMCESAELPPELQGIQYISYHDFETLQRVLRQRLGR